jgi:hypothetical protein
MNLKNLIWVVLVITFALLVSCADDNKSRRPLDFGPTTTVATVNITLNTSDGGSVNGAIVGLTNNNGNTSQIYSKTATGNTVNFTEVPHGTYTLTVIHSGYAQFTITDFSIQSATVDRAVTLTPGSSSSVATVNITVNRSGGGPANGATVRLEGASFTNNVSVAEGRASFTNVPFGTYTLTIGLNLGSGGNESHSDANFSVLTETVNRTVTLTAGSSTTNATVNITLNTSNGGSVVGAEVRLRNNASMDISMVRNATTSIVTFTDVPMFGTYTLTVTHSGYAQFVDANFLVQTETVNRTVTLTAETGYQIGSTGPAGGIIFYDKGFTSEGWRYLEAAPASSEFGASWGTYGNNVAGTSTAIGAGRQNTNLIVGVLNQFGESNQAAQRCQALNINGFTDWFLPSLDELNMMHTQIGHFVGFQNDAYWTSTQRDSWTATVMDFWSGSSYGRDKFYSARVRAIRSF